MAARPKTVNEYLARLPDDQRAALQKLRRDIKSAAPKAVGGISYGVPAFRHGRMLVGFGAAKNHCAFFLMSSTTVEAHQNELKDYDTSKGTIRFAPEKPLPVRLVKKLVKARLAENHKKDASGRE
jgi:uncharacterized protein YdhG (YjbR/CyaY superfamily)